MTGPLADLRVIAVEQYGAGPWATMQLADLGADVVKVEDPAVGGDVGRYVPPFQDGDSSLFFESFVGCDVDLSLFETALSQLSYMATWSASRGHQPVRRERSAHQSLVPFQNFPTADGWMVVACPKENLWRALCVAIERPDLAADTRYASFAARGAHRAELVAELDATFASRPTGAWVPLLTAHRVPCAAINDVEAALSDPQAVARGRVEAAEHPVLGTVRQVASPLRVGDWRPEPRRAPLLGEHDEEVVEGLSARPG